MSSKRPAHDATAPKESQRLAIEGGQPVRTTPLPWELPGAHWMGAEELELAARVIKAQSPFRYYGIAPQHMADRLEKEYAQALYRNYAIAVGSGTGAIAAYEANLRLIRSGSYENKKMRLIVSQNLPFAPMARAWEKGARIMGRIDESEAIKQIDRMDAKVLSNRYPPYGIIGGLYDALRDTDGDIAAVENREVREARSLFMETEGRDICPEAGVALASLIRKVRDGSVERDACIMLNITGGGIDALRREHSLRRITPHLVVDKDSFGPETLRSKVSYLI